MWDYDDDDEYVHEIDGLTYDPSRPPDPEAWLELDEDERFLLVQASHHRLGAEMPTEEQRRLHVAIHVIAENQLAADDPPEARQALDRLLRAGVKRHSAIHAIGGAITHVMFTLLKEHKNPEAGMYEDALGSIDPEAWIRDTAGEPDA